MNLMDFINKCSPTLDKSETVKNNAAGVSETALSTELRNEDVYNYLVDHFKQQLLCKSFGKVITFPMSFTVVLNEKDFNEFKDYSQVVSEQAIFSFYEVISEAMTVGKVCKNLATYWNICFMPSSDEPVDINDNFIRVERGDHFIFSCVHDTLSSIEKEGTSGGSTFTVSKGGSRLFENININKEVIKDLRLVNEAHVQMNWESAYIYSRGTMDKSEESVPHAGNAVAKLLCNGKEYQIVNGTYVVSGADETRNDPNIFVIDTYFIHCDHLHIQYIEKDKKFKMAAYHGNVMLNDEPVKVSSSSDKIFYDLKDGDSIDVGDVVITFRTLR